MEYRRLGRSDIRAGVVGLGAEYLEKSPRQTIISIVDALLEAGGNYIDLFMASPGVRDHFGAALKGRRHRAIVAGHLGSTLKNRQYSRSRDPALCRRFFDDLLTRLQTDYIDVLMLHFIDEPEDLEQVFAGGGLLEMAQRLQQEGKARLIGLSSHYVPVALAAVRSGHINVLMFPVNPAIDTLPAGTELEAIWQADTYRQPGTGIDPRRNDLYHACAVHGVGLVAMKPYSAGWLLRAENPASITLTPVQCLSYALDRPGVSCAVPGCRTVEEMQAALAYVTAGEEEREYSAISTNHAWKLRGSCMYCNHCLPCPVSINIGTVTRLADITGYGRTAAVVSEYEALPVHASACTECGICTERCPFGVDVVANMRRAAGLFGK